MKELTIEEKVERYDKAIERAKKVLLDCTSEEQKVVEYITPELKESEDERVRKTLKEYFINSFQNNGVAAICGMHIKDILAWLEKQGKNNMSISEATKQELEDNLNKALEKETPESCNEFLEKQGEQKTADNKDYSAPLDIEIPFGAKDSKLIQETIRIPDGCYAFIEGNEIVIKKGEKPAWSEEDEKVLHAIRNALHYEKPRNYLKSRDFEFTDILDWLKSLKDRYTWKPSDEQINALEYYIYSNSPTATITKGTIYGNLMVELLEQLKKLKGE